MPAATADRAGWATDIYAALSALGIEPTSPNICAVLAVTEQESSFRADPAVPNLGRIARAEIDRRAGRAGVPAVAVDLALKLRSTDGRSYGERIDVVRTERELSEIFEDFIGMVPPGQAPVRRLESGSHRRPDAGEHRLRRGAREAARLSVSGGRLDPP